MADQTELQPAPTSLPEAPRGSQPAKVDDKGRVKLPVDYQRYLGEFHDNRVFVTSLPDKIVRIYPQALWKEAEAIFEDPAGDPVRADEIFDVLINNGYDSEMDKEGRILLPAKLRKVIGLEGEVVSVTTHRGVIRLELEKSVNERMAMIAARGDFLERVNEFRRDNKAFRV